MVIPRTTPPAWLAEVQELTRLELAQFEADLRDGTLIESEAQPKLLEAALRAVRQRLVAKDRLMTSITLRVPVDVVDSMKSIAEKRGFAGYQTLLKAYLSEGLRRDEAARATHA